MASLLLIAVTASSVRSPRRSGSAHRSTDVTDCEERVKTSHFTPSLPYTKDINKGHHPMLKRLPNGKLLYLPNAIDPDTARKWMEESEKRSTVEDGRNLFTEMFGDES